MSSRLSLGALLAATLLASAPATRAQSAMTDAQLLASFSASSSRYTQQGGETLYHSLCQGCHMPDGQGASSGSGFFPDLRKNPRLAHANYPALIVLRGLHGMPPFGTWLDDQQVADVVNYVRTHFGNQFSDDALTPRAVADLRTPAK